MEIVSKDLGKTGTWTDPRDGQVYPTKIMLNGVTWMTKNYNLKTPQSVYYDNNPAYAETYGRLYTYAEIMSYIPDGWHIPNMYEWRDLSDYYEPEKYEGLFKGQKDAEGINWGFNALKGGVWEEKNGFNSMGYCASYLTTTDLGDFGPPQHIICNMIGCISFSTQFPDSQVKASCRLVISGY